MLHDHSTLNLDELRNLPTCELPDRYHLQTDPGNGCAGDPPGYPTYFTRSVYTPAGNPPTRGPEQVISHDGVLYVTGSSGDWGKGETFDTVHARSHALMRRLYVSLPFDHPRVQAWIAQTMRHQASMYIDDEGLAENPEYGRPARIVFPTPDYKLHHFHDGSLKKRYGRPGSNSPSSRRSCLRCSWAGPLSKTRIQDLGEGLPIHVCPHCGGKDLMVIR